LHVHEIDVSCKGQRGAAFRGFKFNFYADFMRQKEREAAASPCST
jgi:hypothetical protein